MPDWLRDSFAQGPEIALEVLLLRLCTAFVLGVAVGGIYFGTHRRDHTYQPTFLSTLVMLTILIALVTQVIGDSVARAFSLVGALSIVRFRTIVQDTRDTAFVIFSVVLGMAIGGGHLQVALAGLAVGGLAAAVIRPRTPPAEAQLPEWNLTLRVVLGKDLAVLEPVFAQRLLSVLATGTSTGRQGAALDLTYRVRLNPATSPALLVADLNQLEGVQSVELVRR